MAEPSDVPVAALRRLARGLLYDRDRAEDVVQDAWLAALRRGLPSEGLHPWLAEAIRRIAPARLRDETRRRAREERVARAEQQPSTVEVAGRIEILHRLLDAVNALEEPYRSAIALRYLEDLPPRAIAKRLGLPVNTVRTHVRRGLERLRRELDGERGRDRQEFLAALVPLAGRVPWTLTARWTGAAVVRNKALLAASLAAVLGIAWLVLRASPGNGRTSELTTALAAPGTPSRGAASASTNVVEPASSLRNAREPIGSSSEAMNASWVVRGHAFRGPSEPFLHLPLVGRVYAGPSEGTPLIEEHFATDEAGDFAWSLPPPSDLVTVSVDPEIAEHYARSAAGAFVPGDPAPERWTVGAHPLDCILRGTVRDASGHPVPHAQVSNIHDQKTICDEEGRYSLCASSKGEFASALQVTVDAPGFAEKYFNVDSSHTGEVPVPDVILAQELRVRGRVLDADGAPIADARVESFFSPEPVATTTNEAGAFELGNQDPAGALLAVTKSGFAETIEDLTREHLQAELEIRLARSVHVTGRVLTPDHAPVWGAFITVGNGILEGELDVSRRMAYSDREGRFAIEGVSAGVQHFWLKKVGFAQVRVEVSIPMDATTFDGEVILEPEHFLGGVVLDDHGTAIPWAKIDVEEENAHGPLSAIEGTYTDSDGRFRVGGLPAGTAQISITAAGRARWEQAFSALDRDDLVLQMKPSSGFAGRVVDAETGAPIPSFIVRVGSPPSEFSEEGIGRFPANGAGVPVTSPEGTWSLDSDSEPGRVASIGIQAPGYAFTTVAAVRTAIAPSPDDLVIRLVRSTTLRGRVVEQASGAPIEGARLRRLTPRLSLQTLEYPDVFRDWPSSEPLLEARTDATGHFEFRDVPAGEMTLAVDHPDWVIALDGPFDVNGPAPVERRIELGHGATIHGRLLDAAGRSKSGETVSLRCYADAQGNGMNKDVKWNTTTDAEGSFTFTNLAGGGYELSSWSAYGDMSLSRYITIQSSDTIVADLQLLGRSHLSGTLAFGDGVTPPPDGFWVHVGPVASEPIDPSRERWAKSRWLAWARDGRFELVPLEPGEYEVSAEFDSGETDASGQSAASVYGEARVVVPEDGAVEVRLFLEQHER